MNNTVLNILFFLGLLSTSFTVEAQNTSGLLPAVVNYSKFDYRGGGQNWDIGQDKQGVMYFANNKGLLTFDGNHWKLYPLPNNTVIWSLAVSDDGKIYVGGQDEIGYFSPNTNGILTFTSLKQYISEQNKNFADIWHIAVLGRSVFFQADRCIFEYRDKSIKVHTSNLQWLFMSRVGDQIYASDKTTGLMKFDKNQWAPVSDGKKLAGIHIAGIILMGKDSTFIVSRTKGIFLLNRGRITSQINNFPNHLYINDAAKLSNSELLLASSSGGSHIVNVRNNKWQSFSNEQGLQNNNALSVLRDHSGNLWTGLSSGISYININSAITYLRIDKAKDLPAYSASIFKSSLYVATSNGLYTAPVADTKNIHISKDEFSLVKNTENREAWNLTELNGHLLLANDYGTFDVLGNEAKQLSRDTGSWYFLPLSPVYPSRNIIVGTYYGLKLFRYENNSFFNQGKITGAPNSFRFMALDDNGDIWASHPYRGIFRIRLSHDRKKFSFHLYTANDGLPSTLNNFVFKIKDRIVFATTKGLYEFNRSSNSFIPSKLYTAVFNKMAIRYLNEDKEGNIWFCNERGTGVIHSSANDPSRLPMLTYFPELNEQLLPGFENIYPYNRRNIFIGSEKGLIHLDFQKYISAKQHLEIRLGIIKTIGKADSTIFGGYPIRREIIQLPSSTNAFRFEYSSPVYDFQRNITYSYQLEGYDNDWSAWDNKTEKDYTNLSDGKYTFKVKARDYQLKESAIASYSFIIKAPWYKTIWAKIGYLFIFIGIAVIARKYLKHKLQLQQLKFDKEQKKLKYIHQLEIEKNEKEIIKLQNEKLGQEILLQKKELANTSMHLLEKADALSKIKEKVSKLNDKTDDIKRINELIKDSEKINANWDVFAAHFDELNDNFLNKLKKQYPQLTKSDLKVCAYLRLNLSTKEIAQLLSITVRGAEVCRYRIRKKIRLPTEQSLTTFFNQI